MQTRKYLPSGVQAHTPAGRIMVALNMFGLTDGAVGDAVAIDHNVAITHLELAFAEQRS